MLKKVKNKNDALLGRLISLILLLFIYKALCYIPIPWINKEALDTISSSGVFTILNTFNDSSFTNFTFMATGISSYVGASIILQIISFISPTFHDLHKTPGGKKKLTFYTLIFGVILAFISSLGTTLIFQNYYKILTNDAWYVYLFIALFHSCGTFFAVLIGETITKLNFGNGCSILIFSNILSGASTLVQIIITSIINNATTFLNAIIFAIIFSIIFLLCIFLDNIKKIIPIQYSQTTVRNKIASLDLKSYYKIRLNISGVLPIIFSMAIFQSISIIADLIPDLNINGILNNIVEQDSFLYYAILLPLIFIFNFLYTYLIFDPKEISQSLQQYFASFPNIRIGKETEKFLKKTRTKMWILSSICLSSLILIISFFLNYMNITTISATSIIVLISVSLEIFTSIYSEIKIRKI